MPGPKAVALEAARLLAHESPDPIDGGELLGMTFDVATGVIKIEIVGCEPEEI